MESTNLSTSDNPIHPIMSIKSHSVKISPSANRPSTGTASSFQDFQESINHVWNLEDDDEFFSVSGLENTIISKKASQAAALNVLNTHKTQLAVIDNSTSKVSIGTSAQNLGANIEVRESYTRIQSEDSDDSDSKIEKFMTLLNSEPELQDICKLSWSGVPAKVRPIVWRLLSGYLPINVERRLDMLHRKRQDYWNLVQKYYYAELDETNRDIKHQISIDVPRMNPSVKLFKQKTVQSMFERILFIWAIRHPASGYVQGINDLVTPFYAVFLQESISDAEPFETCNIDALDREELRAIEADSFWCLSKFLDGIQDNYVFAQVGIQLKVHQLEELIKRIDEPLHAHLKRHNVSYLQFSFRWLNNLLTRELPLRCTIRLWDTYLSESDCFASFQLYVCAAFLRYWRSKLMEQTDFQGLLLLLQNLPTQDWNHSHICLLLAEAYQLKVMFADAPNHLQNVPSAIAMHNKAIGNSS